MAESAAEPFVVPGLDLTHPSNARVYDHFLGGSHSWAVDRAIGDRALREFPLLRAIAQANRLFLHRVVRHLLRRGVRQFVDIGSGLPTMGPVHEIAEAVAPGEARIVYVDHEPLAVAESQVQLEESGDVRRHAAVHADLRDPDGLWELVARTGTVDLDQPVGLLIIAVLHVEQPVGTQPDAGPRCVARLRELLSPQSYLAISHITDERVPDGCRHRLDRFKQLCRTAGSLAVWRSHREIEELFGDFRFIEPGPTWTPLWRPEESPQDAPVVTFERPSESVVWAGVAQKHTQQS